MKRSMLMVNLDLSNVPNKLKWVVFNDLNIPTENTKTFLLRIITPEIKQIMQEHNIFVNGRNEF